MKRFVLCITGASGVIYGVRTLEVLHPEFDLDVVISSTAKVVLKEELGLVQEDLEKRFPRARFWNEKDFTAPIASGSTLKLYEAVFVIPCSTGTLGCVAGGVNINLIHRVCEVALKERVKLVMVVREAPYSLIHLENMVKLTKAGAVIVPASPAFYHGPKTVDDLINFVVGKVLDQVGVDHRLFKRWKEGRL